MHELSLLKGVVTKVTDVAAGRSVTAVGLTVGARSGVIPEALESAWPIATADTPFPDARLDVEYLPATVYCPTCAGEQEIDEFFALTCPECGTPTADLRQGKEFAITWVDVE